MSSSTDLINVQNFIDGEFRDAVSGEWLDNYEPATGKVFSKVCSSDSADVDLAYAAAKAAYPAWKKTTLEQRSKYLYRIAEVLTSRLVRIFNKFTFYGLTFAPFSVLCILTHSLTY